MGAAQKQLFLNMTLVMHLSITMVGREKEEATSFCSAPVLLLEGDHTQRQGTISRAAQDDQVCSGAQAAL